MHFETDKAIEILERIPQVISELLSGLSDEWIKADEGDKTWNAYDIVGHLIHGEKTDWIIRMEIILSDNAGRKFEPFDRFAQFQDSKDKGLQELLAEFRQLRMKNIETLKSKKLSEKDLLKTGIHPAFGEVTLSQLLSAWVVHDLNHIAQISRVMAKQYKNEVGPWIDYMKILNIN